MNKLHPGARWIFRFRAYGSLLFLFIFVLVYSFQILRLIIGNTSILWSLFPIIFCIFLIVTISETYARMSYNRYLYEIASDGIKIEKGIIWKKYTSIPYERVQNIDIKRGIIARMLGFSTVEIETAGQSGYPAGYYGFRFGRRGSRRYESEGHLPAIDLDYAEEIRSFVIKKIKQTQGSGL